MPRTKPDPVVRRFQAAVARQLASESARLVRSPEQPLADPCERLRAWAGLPGQPEPRQEGRQEVRQEPEPRQQRLRIGWGGLGRGRR